MANEINKYLVDDATVDQFQNITTFVKNMVIKDSLLYENAETDISKWFGDMLLKYYNSELSIEEIKNLFTFVYKYNENVKEQLGKAEGLLKAYGLYKTQDFNKSILNIIIESIISDNDAILKESTLEEKFSDKEKLKSYIFLSYFKDKFTSLNKNDLNFNYDEAFKKPENLNINISEDAITKLKIAFEEKEYIHMIFKALTRESLISEKNKANEFEKTMAANGNPLLYFNLKISQDTNFFKDEEDYNNFKHLIETINIEGNIPNKSPIINFTNNTNNGIGLLSEGKNIIEMVIFYKELNPQYRAVLDSTNIELNLYCYNTNNKSIYSELTTTISNNIDANIFPLNGVSFFNSVRNTDSSKFLARDFNYTENNEEIFKTSQLFKSEYANAYVARNAAESEIIAYYMGDTYISNNYGEFNYQKEEIYEFLKIYQETRDYYYKVLANESFTKEEQYPLYEKAFISFWAIERFITGKLDNLKNIDMYNLTDITNFFETYGFKDLAKIITDQNLYDPILEEYSKNLIRSYVDLIQNKGSKGIINKIEDSFSIDRQSLSIYRNYLYNKQEPETKIIKEVDKDGKETNKTVNKNIFEITKEGKYYFSKLNDNNDWNPIDTINRSTSEISLKNTVGTGKNIDIYWDYNDTPESMLHNLGLETSNTKYIIPQIINEFSVSYIYARVALAIIKYVADELKDFVDFGTIESPFNFNPFTSTSKDKISKYIDYIAYCFTKYIESLNEGNSDAFHNDNSDFFRTFVINIDKFEAYTQFFTISNSSTNNLEIVSVKKEYIAKYFDFTYTLENNNININNNDDKDDFNKIVEVLENFKILYLLYQYKNKLINSDKFKDIFKNIYENANSSGNVSFSKVFDDLIELPISIARGSIDYSNNSQYIGLNYKIKKFIIGLYEDIYFTTSADEIKNDILYCADTSITINSEDWKQLLIDGLTSLKEITTEFLNLNLYASVGSVIKFLSAAIDYFISYTTQIYSFEYISSYENKSETIAPTDYIVIDKIRMQEQDSFFYDESLTIKEVIDE